MVIIEQVKLFPNYFPNQPIFDPKPFCLDITSIGGTIGSWFACLSVAFKLGKQLSSGNCPAIVGVGY